jgi:hypothetical protein
MNLQPWDYWTHEGEPKGRIEEIVAVLERAMRTAPDHPGANHFYIHAVEASNDPDRAVPAADRLTHLVPGSGHLVHMPSHIYVRVGRYPTPSSRTSRRGDRPRLLRQGAAAGHLRDVLRAQPPLPGLSRR